jgi:hypothetical protein
MHKGWGMANLFVKRKSTATTYSHVQNILQEITQDYHQLPHNLKIYNSRPVIAGCKLFEKLPDHM